MIVSVAASGQEAALRGKIGIPRPAGSREPSEAEAIRDLKRGKRDAVDVVFRSRWAEIHRTAFLIVRDASAAEDIAQESMLALIRSIKSFDESKPLGPWLHRIVVNRSLDWIRSRERRHETDQGDVRTESIPGPDSTGLLEALQELDPAQRAAVVLRHLLGYSPGEIAEIVGDPPSTIRSRLQRGLAKLKDLIEVDRRG